VAAAFALSAAVSVARAGDKVKVAIPGIASDIGFFIADKKGYFRDEGLDVEMTRIDVSPQMTAPLGMGSSTSAPARSPSTSTTRWRATSACGSSPTRARSGRATDFRGCWCARITSQATLQELQGLEGDENRRRHLRQQQFVGCQRALKKGGLTWGDAAMVEINFPQHLAAHVNKAIDASMTNEPTATRAVQGHRSTCCRQ